MQTVTFVMVLAAVVAAVYPGVANGARSERQALTPRAQAKLDASDANTAAHTLADKVRTDAFTAAQILVQAAQDALLEARANSGDDVVSAAEAVLAPLLLVQTATQNVADVVQVQAYQDADAARDVAFDVADTYADTY